MTVENSKKANLRPLNVKVGLVFGLQNVENNGHPVFVVVSNDPLVGVGRV
jgi:hypothetical protein